MREEDTKNFCPYCRSDISGIKEWKSCFCGDIHYKSATCNCGRKIDIKVNFEGSGHDMWSGAPTWMFEEANSEKSKTDIDKVVEEHHNAIEDRREKSDDSDKKRRKDD